MMRSSSFAGLGIDALEATNASLEGATHQVNRSSCDDSAEGDGISRDLDDENDKEVSAMVKDVHAMVKDETVAVEKMRTVILTVLCITIVGISLAVIFYSRLLEYNQFEDQFESDAQKIAQEAGNKLNLMLEAMDSFLAATATLANVTNMSWPFVTTQNFADRTSRILRRTNTLSLSQFHLVSNKQRLEWESYSLENDAWVEQGIDFLRGDSSFEGSIIEDYESSAFIYDDEGKIDESVSYLPKWQHAPVVPIEPPYNFDGFSSMKLNSSWFSLEEGHAIVSHVLNMADSSSSSSVAQAERNKEWIKTIAGDQRANDDPLSELYYPIFREPWNNESSTPVGVLSLAFFWSDMLRNILSSWDQVIYAVFRSQCDNVFSIQMNGPNVTFLGAGDRHDTKYTYLEESFSVEDLSGYAVDDLVGFPLAQGNCSYVVSFYPHDSYNNSFHTVTPVIFSVAAFCILIFAAVLFLLYDSLVELRQGALMSEGKFHDDSFFDLRNLSDSIAWSRFRSRSFGCNRIFVVSGKCTEQNLCN
jgi:hypothetical protein